MLVVTAAAAMIDKCSYSKARLSCCLATVTLIIVIIYTSYLSTTISLQYKPASIMNLISSKMNRTEDEYGSNRPPGRSEFEKCERRLPGAIIAGIQKCGTGALMVFLNTHPEIAGVINPRFPDDNMAMELKFFTKEYRKGLEWYRSKMPCSYSDQITIEKDPPYFYEKHCARRIKMIDPDIKIIFIVKEPIERALSNHAMAVKGHITAHPTFEEKVTDVNGTIRKGFSYIKRSNYSKFISPWIEQFGLGQIHFVDGHKFEEEPVVELQRVEKFLKIQPYFVEKMFWFNETKGKHCFYSKDAKALCLGESKGKEHAIISESLRVELQRYFKPLNEQFFEKINRRFNWGY